MSRIIAERKATPWAHALPPEEETNTRKRPFTNTSPPTAPKRQAGSKEALPVTDATLTTRRGRIALAERDTNMRPAGGRSGTRAYTREKITEQRNDQENTDVNMDDQTEVLNG